MQYDFSKHVVDHYSSAEVPQRLETLFFRIPDSPFEYLGFHRIHNLLLVTGDYGNAVYGWNTPEMLTLEWMADTDFGYFFGKCTAAPPANCTSGSYRTWDSKAFMERLRQELTRYCEFTGEKTADEILEQIEREIGHLDVAQLGPYDWASWLQGYEVDLEEILDSDYVSSHELHSIDGYIPHPWAHAHHQGLKAAIAQLKEKGKL